MGAIRTRHARYRRPERAFRRAGIGGNVPVVAFQANLAPSDFNAWIAGIEIATTLLTDGAADIVEVLNVSPGDDVGARTNEFTFEEANAASIPGDLGLT